MTAPSTPPQGRLLRDSALNIGGQGLPLLAALVAIPILVSTLGSERVGLLTLGWAVIGYFSLFDLGLGRSLTHAVSSRHGMDEGETAVLIRAALRLMLWLGVAGGIVLAAATRWLVVGAMDITPALHGETLVAFYLLAASVPVVVLTSGMRGVLEAHHRFDIVNAIRAPLGVFTFAAPLALLPFTHSLAAVIAMLLAGRVVGLVAHAVACARIVPALRHEVAGTAPLALGPLIRNGGWMTVSNVVSPLMSTADRFLIASLASAAVVAFYTLPYEVAYKVLVLPLSVAAPLFARLASIRDARAEADLMMRGLLLTTLVSFPATLALALAAPEIMEAWMGHAFADRAAPVLRILALGMFLNSVAQTPFAMLQARGRADLTAKLHLVELPLYLAGVVLLVRAFGIEGAAIAWVVRAGFDCLLLTIVAFRINPAAADSTRVVPWVVVSFATVAMTLATLMPAGTVAARAGYGVVAILAVTLAILAASGRMRAGPAPG